MRVDPLLFIALLWPLATLLVAFSQPRRPKRPRPVHITYRAGRAPGIPRPVA